MLRGQLVTRGGSRGRDRSSGAMQGTNGHIKGTLRNNPSKASPVKVATAAAAETARLFVSNLNQVRCWSEATHALRERWPLINQSLSMISERDYWINTHFALCYLSPACACFWALPPGYVEKGFPPPILYRCHLSLRCRHDVSIYAAKRFTSPIQGSSCVVPLCARPSVVERTPLPGAVSRALLKLWRRTM